MQLDFHEAATTEEIAVSSHVGVNGLAGSADLHANKTAVHADQKQCPYA